MLLVSINSDQDDIGYKFVMAIISRVLHFTSVELAERSAQLSAIFNDLNRMEYNLKGPVAK